jgi:hypothetical protein
VALAQPLSVPVLLATGLVYVAYFQIINNTEKRFFFIILFVKVEEYESNILTLKTDP